MGKYFFKINERFFSLLGIILFIITTSLNAQIYHVNYNNLSDELLTGKEPIKICILEQVASNNRLYDGLIQDSLIKIKFLIYPTDVLIENRESLGNELYPENENFLQALRDILGVEYLLNWHALSDSSGGYNLEVYSTKNHQKIYGKEFYFSNNSSPVLDVKKLINENLEPIYELTYGEIQISEAQETIKFKLYRNEEIIKEWSGSSKQKIEAGKYILVSEAYGYKEDTKTIEIQPDKLNTLNINLEVEVSELPYIFSSDAAVSNIKIYPSVKQLKISYDLDGENEFDVALYLKNTSTQKVNKLAQVSGDFGTVKSGKDKTIIWNFTNEIGNNSDLKNYEIRISAEKKGGIPWYYYAGGALVAGGAAILLLGGSDNAETPTRDKINPPPSRPTGN